MRVFIVLAILAFGTLQFTGNAQATPIFTGNPFADFGTGDTGLPPNPLGPGYYIWANDPAFTSWSVRWTGRDWVGGVDGSYVWAGEIVFSNFDGLDEPVMVLWDGIDDPKLTKIDGSLIDGNEMIAFAATEGSYWDGFDFSLNGVTGDYLTFFLRSDFLTEENDGIYIGPDLDSILDNSDSTEFFRTNDGQGRQFEMAAPVPEPGTLLLLGSGLAGWGLIRRRQKS